MILIIPYFESLYNSTIAIAEKGSSSSILIPRAADSDKILVSC